MAEIFGGKWIFGCGILLTSIFTVIMPWAAKTDIRLLIAVRVIEGLGEGTIFLPIIFLFTFLVSCLFTFQKQCKILIFRMWNPDRFCSLSMDITPMSCL